MYKWSLSPFVLLPVRLVQSVWVSSNVPARLSCYQIWFKFEIFFDPPSERFTFLILIVSGFVLIFCYIYLCLSRAFESTSFVSEVVAFIQSMVKTEGQNVSWRAANTPQVFTFHTKNITDPQGFTGITLHEFWGLNILQITCSHGKCSNTAFRFVHLGAFSIFARRMI